jgi:hypothetical protein
VYKGLSVTLMVTNMLNWKTRWTQTQGEQKVTNYEMRPGATIWFGLAYEL